MCEFFLFFFFINDLQNTEKNKFVHNFENFLSFKFNKNIWTNIFLKTIFLHQN